MIFDINLLLKSFLYFRNEHIVILLEFVIDISYLLNGRSK